MPDFKPFVGLFVWRRSGVVIFISLGKELAALGHLFLAGNKYHHPTLMGLSDISRAVQGLSVFYLKVGYVKQAQNQTQAKPLNTVETTRTP
ncbi:MAG: hypothetical protein ABJM11_08690 [Marinobacter sp.]|uniref:hypothetical protein n=1 Tax=Marinobacter sp. TaxID=50741 RepID=UPI003299D30E